MVDILEGVVLDVVDGGMLELEVEHVEARDAGRYGSREWVRVGETGHLSRDVASDEEAAAHMIMDYENRRVRCYVQERDDQGHLIGEIEVLGDDIGDEPYGIADEGE